MIDYKIACSLIKVVIKGPGGKQTKNRFQIGQ